MRSSASAGPVVWSIAAWRSGRTNAISRPRRCPSGHVRDHHAQRAAATSKPEEVEEIAADLARGLVMGRDVVARHVRWRERHETALEAPPGPSSSSIRRASAACWAAIADRSRAPPRARPRAFGHGRAADRRRTPRRGSAADSAPAGISRVTTSPAGRPSRCSRSASRRRHRSRGTGRIETAERRDDRVEVELGRGLGRHARPGDAIRLERWRRRWPWIGPRGR